ncbi:MAG: hypothetical protein KGJ59_09295 [Bacteroidota bacterium]|nr:hypothetical protein [Bacteroidota bacterium]
MKKFFTTLCCALIFLPLTFFAQSLSEKVDTSVIAHIKNEEMNRSQVMNIESYLTDVYGPRLTASPEFEQAAKWTEQKLKDIGLENVTIETWGPFGRGWSLKKFSAEMVAPRVSPLIAYPKAWSPGTDGVVESEVVYLKASNEAELDQYKGKLKGKIVLLSDPEELHPHFKPDAERRSEEDLLKMANAGAPPPRGRFPFGDSTAMQRFRQRLNLVRMKMEFCQKRKSSIAYRSLAR